ncbi:hypothetical protein BJX64DRAFT_288788 [Aspergillus heterothallicus]
MHAIGSLLCFSASLSSAMVVNRASATVTVALPQATILGNIKDNVDSFSGIPYAEPSFISSPYDYGTPAMGTLHGCDLLQVFDDYEAKITRTYFINSVHSLDPNGDQTSALPAWPHRAKGRELINFAKDKATTLADGFRSNRFEVIKKLRVVVRL